MAIPWKWWASGYAFTGVDQYDGHAGQAGLGDISLKAYPVVSGAINIL